MRGCLSAHRWRHTQSFRLVKQCFAKLLLPDEMPLDETLLTIFGAFQINSFSVRDAASVIIGEGAKLLSDVWFFLNITGVVRRPLSATLDGQPQLSAECCLLL